MTWEPTTEERLNEIESQLKGLDQSVSDILTFLHRVGDGYNEFNGKRSDRK